MILSENNGQKKLTFENIVLRAVAAWTVTTFIVKLFLTENSFLLLEFGQDISVFALLIVFISCFVALSLLDLYLPKLQVDGLALLVFLFLYALILMPDVQREASEGSDVYFITVIMAFIAVAVVYLYRKAKLPVFLKNGNIPKSVSMTGVILIFALCAAFISAVTVFRYLSYSSPNYDFGIFCNMFHHMRTGFLPTVSCERNQLLSHFAVHVSPIYYVLLPFYAVFPYPETLQIGQGVVLACGVFPLYLIARNKKLSRFTSLALCAVYALYPALSGGCFYDLHENCFLTPLLLWTMYFYEKKQFVPMYIFAFATLLVKEDAAVYVAFFALYIIFSDKEFLHGAAMLAMSVAYFLIVTALLSAYGDGVMSYRYDNLIYGQTRLSGVFKTLFVNPGYVFSQMLTGPKFLYLLKMFIPLAFLPFFTKKTSRFILVLPMVLISLMTNYVYQYDIGFQYQFGIIAFLIYAVVLNLADFKSANRKPLLTVSLMAACLMFSVTAAPKLTTYADRYIAYKDTYQRINTVLEQIPGDATVKCTTFILPHVANRNEVYEIKYDPQNIHQTDYIILDMRPGYSTESQQYLDEYLKLGYVVLVNEENAVTVLIRNDLQFSKNQ